MDRLQIIVYLLFGGGFLAYEGWAYRRNRSTKAKIAPLVLVLASIVLLLFAAGSMIGALILISIMKLSLYVLFIIAFLEMLLSFYRKQRIKAFLLLLLEIAAGLVYLYARRAFGI
ncbi:hypothetical protein [Paenibacillus sp.]|uniref:hypothetical protein n=1 Tax=Paenibacillus sp. TaxID=58172 RepID=UPI002D6367AD|nr:hypothetical protein [Paenibacillus sp.]HZG84280.1 hypothetical protein [Paenibacillus sp.]